MIPLTRRQRYKASLSSLVVERSVGTLRSPGATGSLPTTQPFSQSDATKSVCHVLLEARSFFCVDAYKIQQLPKRWPHTGGRRWLHKGAIIQYGACDGQQCIL